ncbi:MAG: hypothetical protein EOP85_02035 [Verrucomicrobiaceae bacterium]|nr:MAG: hypothetical protein EOP85_02035 [Verrucomicrobiaceae bacterium]
MLAGKTTREGDKQLRLLPENFDSLSPKDQDTAIDEGISRLMEAEVLRTRKGGGHKDPYNHLTKLHKLDSREDISWRFDIASAPSYCM